MHHKMHWAFDINMSMQCCLVLQMKINAQIELNWIGGSGERVQEREKIGVFCVRRCGLTVQVAQVKEAEWKVRCNSIVDAESGVVPVDSWESTKKKKRKETKKRKKEEKRRTGVARTVVTPWVR